jgi:hypothetical protein
MKADDVPYEEKLKAFAAHKLEYDPDYYTEDGSFIVNEQIDGEWMPVRAIPPDRKSIERWWELKHGEKD